mmetsp:Transcript_132628/g.369767  ORF Transcript_132628/g.369767 Transcript_132628/m.369767 type:complete len:81 (-) Transcript_132628:151-393(-)
MCNLHGYSAQGMMQGGPGLCLEDTSPPWERTCVRASALGLAKQGPAQPLPLLASGTGRRQRFILRSKQRPAASGGRLLAL